MNTFNIGDVWLAIFPYDDDSNKYKIRPVIVLDESTIGILSVKVTSHEAREFDPYDVPLFYWSEAGLRLASTARVSKTIYLDPSVFKTKIGTLVADDLLKVLQTYKDFISGS